MNVLATGIVYNFAWNECKFKQNFWTTTCFKLELCISLLVFDHFVGLLLKDLHSFH